MTFFSSPRSLVILTCSFFLATGVSARADVQALQGFDNEIWGSIGTSQLNYKEPSTAPDLPDSERGWMPSFAVGASALLPNSNLYLAVEGAVATGNVDYNGAYFYYPTVALKSTTAETVSTIDGKIGQGFAISRSAMLIPYVELGYRYWDRNFGGGQVEDYQNFDTLGGLMLQIAPTNRLLLSGYGSAGTTFSAQMKTGGETYNLGSSGMYKLGGKLGYDLTQRVEAFTTLDYDYFRYGQSSVIGNAYEPNSHTEETTWRVGLAYHFR